MVVPFLLSLFPQSTLAMNSPSGKSEDWISDPTMFPRHGSWHDGAAAGRHATAHDKIVTLVEIGDEGFDAGKVIAVIGISHEDPLAGRRFNATAERVAVSFARDVNDAGTFADGDVLRAIRAAIVGDDDFTLDSRFADGFPGFPDAGGEGFRLVQAGHDNR